MRGCWRRRSRWTTGYLGLYLTMFVAGLLSPREVALLPLEDMEDRDA